MFDPRFAIQYLVYLLFFSSERSWQFTEKCEALGYIFYIS